MKLIGVGGTNGSGKDALSDILADEYDWLFISVSRDLLIPELERRRLPPERQHMAALSAEWNRRISPGAVIDKAIEKFEQESKFKKYGGLAISSIRHPWEADKIHKFGGTLVWTDADPNIRYDRIFSRGQGHKDKKTFEQFLAEEQAEMTHSGDQATLNMSGVKTRADVFITNDGDNLKDFKRSIGKALAELL